MNYQVREEPLGVVFTILAGLAVAGVETGMAASDAQQQKQSARYNLEQMKQTSAQAQYDLRNAEQDSESDSSETGSKAGLSMQKYGALAAVGVVVVIGFLVLRK